VFPHPNRNVAFFFELGFFLLMLNLFEYLVVQLVSGFGIWGLPRGLAGYTVPLLNLVGTAIYLRYRMGRSMEYVGLTFERNWAFPLGIGLLLGIGLPLTAAAVGRLFGGAGPAGLPALVDSRFFLLNVADSLLVLLLQVLAVETVHRGMVANRASEEFPYWRALAWAMGFWALSYSSIYIFGHVGMVRWAPLGGLVENGLLHLLSILLFWRTQNLWWPVGVHLGTWIVFRFFFSPFPGLRSGWSVPPRQAVWLVWGLAVAVLLYLDWQEQQRGRGGGRGFRTGGRIVRGPWGPH
jgi:hypothetical protein